MDCLFVVWLFDFSTLPFTTLHGRASDLSVALSTELLLTRLSLSIIEKKKRKWNEKANINRILNWGVDLILDGWSKLLKYGPRQKNIP